MKALADRLGRGSYFSADPVEVFDELRRASAGGIADYAGITYERIDAEDGRLLALPQPRTTRARRGCSPTASRPPTAGPPSSGWTTRLRPRRRTPSYPYVLTTGRLMAQYQSGTQTRRVPSPAQSSVQPEAQLHPDLARRLGVGQRRHRRAVLPPGHGHVPGQGQRRHPARHRLRAVPLGRRLGGQRPHQPRAGPALADARLQGVRGQPGPARRPRRRPPAHPTRHEAVHASHRADAARTPDPRSTSCSTRLAGRTSP